MPKIVELPGNRAVEFPDDFTEDRMNVEIIHAFPDLVRPEVREPGIPPPEEIARPGRLGQPFTPGQAFPVREEKMREVVESQPTREEVERRYQAGELPRLNVPSVSPGHLAQVPIDLQERTFTFGETDAAYRRAHPFMAGVGESVAGLIEFGVNQPEQALGGLVFGPIGTALGLYYGPQVAKQALEDFYAYAVKGDEQAGGRFLGIVGLVGTPLAARGLLRKARNVQAQVAIESARNEWYDRQARETLQPSQAQVRVTEPQAPVFTMEPIRAGDVMIPKARELVPHESEDVFGLGKLTELSNEEIAAASSTLKTEAPATAAELEKVKAETPTPEPTRPPEPATAPRPESLKEGDTLPDFDPEDIGAKARLAEKRAEGKTHEHAVQELSDEISAVGEVVNSLPEGTQIRRKSGQVYENLETEGKPNWCEINERTGDTIPNSVTTGENLRGGKVIRLGKGKRPPPHPEPPPTAPEAKSGPVGEIRKNADGDFEWVENGKVLDIAKDPAELIGAFHSDNAGYSTRVRQVTPEHYELELIEPKDPENPTHELVPYSATEKLKPGLPAPRGGKTVSAEPTPPAKVEAPAAKEPWRMRQQEWQDARHVMRRLEESTQNPDVKAWAKQQLDKFARTHSEEIALAVKEGKPVPPEVLSEYPDLAPKPTAKPSAETGKEMDVPFTMTFEQFLNAPREGRLLEELRKLPRSPKTEAQLAAQAKYDAATENLQKAGLSWVLDRADPKQKAMVEAAMRKLPKTKQKIVAAYETALNEKVKSSSSGTEGQRRLYDKAVEAGIVKPPETPPTWPGVPTPAEQSEIRAELDDTLGGKHGVPLKPLPPGASNVPIKGLHEIIQDLAKGLHLPIRFGRLTATKFAGYFKPIADLIGSKRANDISTISHEVGHKLDKHLKLSSDRSIAGELDMLGDPATPGSGSSWTKSKSRAYKLGEGVGEFVRYWLTDPIEARTKAPNTYAAFETAMNANPDFGDVMRHAQTDIQVWRASPSEARLASHISVGDNPNKTPYRLRQLTRDLVDDLHILRIAVDDAERWLGSKLAPMANPYVLARLLRGAYGRADVFVRHGTVDFKTKAVTLGKSLEDSLKPVSGRMEQFRNFIVAKRAQELHAQGHDSGLLDQDIQATIQHYANDVAFQKAFDAVKDWQDSQLQYARDAGLITDDGLTAMRKMNQQYVPFHRLFEIGAGEVSTLESPGLGRGLNLGKPGSLHKLHGSPRPIVDPLETMIKNAYVLTTAAEKQAVHLALANLANSPGMGKWIEKIATPKEMVKVGLEKIRKQLVDAGADLTNVPDDLLLTFFQNSRQAPFGENIIKVIRDGTPEFYRLNRELFDTFHALDMDDAGRLTKILAAPAQLLRSGVVLAPDFALANAFRDAFSSAIVGRYTIFPFEATIRGLAAMLRRPQLVDEWKAAGGANAVEASYFDRTKMQRFMRESITSDLTPMERAVLIAKGPLTFLRWLTGTAEEATRIGEYQVSYNKLRAAGMSEGDARTMAAYESRDRQDFAKGGAKTKILRLWTPFWNAGLQANVKLAQAFRERPLQTTLKGLAFITTAKVIEQALNWDDEDYWDRPQWERDTFFMIPIGKDQAGKTRFLKLPTPFEPGIIFGTLPGRVFQYLKQKDRRAMDGFMLSVAQQTIPNPTPQGIQVIFEDFLSGSKGWDIFRSRQIVPESIADMPPDLQWTEQTSLTARKLGKLLGFSPMKIDHIIASTSGGLGRQLTHNVSDRLIQLATGEKPTATSQVPGGRFITVPGGIVSQSVEDFYGYFQKIQAEENRFKAQGKGKEWAGLATDFRSAAQQMSQLRTASRMTTDPIEKQKFAIQIAEIAKIYSTEARNIGVK